MVKYIMGFFIHQHAIHHIFIHLVLPHVIISWHFQVDTCHYNMTYLNGHISSYHGISKWTCVIISCHVRHTCEKKRQCVLMHHKFCIIYNDIFSFHFECKWKFVFLVRIFHMFKSTNLACNLSNMSKGNIVSNAICN